MIVAVPVPHIVIVSDHKRLGSRSLSDDVDEVIVEFTFALPDDIRSGNVAVFLQLTIG